MVNMGTSADRPLIVGREDILSLLGQMLIDDRLERKILHLYGIGGIGKRTILRYWQKSIANSIFIDLSVQNTLLEQINYLAGQLRLREYNLPRYDFLWTIKIEVIDKIQSKTGSTITHGLGILEVAPSIIGSAATLAKNIYELVQKYVKKNRGTIKSWIDAHLTETEKSNPALIWSDVQRTEELLFMALLDDFNSHVPVNKERMLILLYGVDLRIENTLVPQQDLESTRNTRWFWFLSSLNNCIAVTAGETPLSKSICDQFAIEQRELLPLNDDDARRLASYFLRNYDELENDPRIVDLIVEISHGHPHSIGHYCDAIIELFLNDTAVDDIIKKASIDGSPSLDVARTKIWIVLFKDAESMGQLIDYAAIVPFFDRNVLQAFIPDLHTETWIRFIHMSFVRPWNNDGWYYLHPVARSNILVELKPRLNDMMEGIKSTLLGLIRKYNDLTYGILAISAMALTDEEYAIGMLQNIYFDLLEKNKYDLLIKFLKLIQMQSRYGWAVVFNLLLGVTTSLGRIVEANQYQQKLIHLYPDHSHLQPNEYDLYLDMQVNIGYLHFFFGNLAMAEKTFLGILKFFETHLPDDPKEFLFPRVFALASLDYLYSAQLKSQLAEQYRKELQYYVRLAKEMDDDTYQLIQFLLSQFKLVSIDKVDDTDDFQISLHTIGRTYVPDDLPDLFSTFWFLAAHEGDVFFSKGQLLHALDKYQQAEQEIAKSAHAYAKMFLVYILIKEAIAYFMKENNELALQKIDQALNQYQASSDQPKYPQLDALINYQFGIFFSTQNQFEQVIPYLSKAIRIIRANSIRTIFEALIAASSLSLLIACYLDLYQLEKAQECYEQIESIYKDGKFVQVKQIQLIFHTSCVLIGSKHPEFPIDKLRASIEFLGHHIDEDSFVDVNAYLMGLHALLQYHYERFELDKVILYALQIIQIGTKTLKTHATKPIIANALRHLALAHSARGESEESHSAAQSCLLVINQFIHELPHNPCLLCLSILSDHGLLRLIVSDLELSRIIQQIIRLWNKTLPYYAIYIMKHALLQRGLQEIAEGKTEYAMKTLHNALSLFEKRDFSSIKDRELKIRLLYLHAAVSLELGNLNEGQQLLQEVLKEFDEIPETCTQFDFNLLIGALAVLGDIYLMQRKLDMVGPIVTRGLKVLNSMKLNNKQPTNFVTRFYLILIKYYISIDEFTKAKSHIEQILKLPEIEHNQNIRAIVGLYHSIVILLLDDDAEYAKKLASQALSLMSSDSLDKTLLWEIIPANFIVAMIFASCDENEAALLHLNSGLDLLESVDISGNPLLLLQKANALFLASVVLDIEGEERKSLEFMIESANTLLEYQKLTNDDTSLEFVKLHIVNFFVELGIDKSIIEEKVKVLLDILREKSPP